MAARIFIVEDHAFMRRTLADYVQDLPDYEVIGMAETAEETLEAFGSEEGGGNPVDLVLVDTRLPGASGIELVRALKQKWPDIHCLMLSGHEERAYVDRALDAGAQGYVLKGKSEEIPEAIEHVLNGRTYLSAALQEQRAAGAQ